MYVLGIDSGASCSTAAIADMNGKVIFTGEFEPLNFNLAGHLKAAQILSNIVSESLRIAKVEVQSIAAGIAGARFKKDRDIIKREISRIHNIGRVIILPDSELAFLSYFEESQTNCGIIIAGSGSILYYKDNDGKMNRAGGWGRLIDDEGSGYWIGREALNRVTKYYDGRSQHTSLAAVIRKNYGLSEHSIIQKIYHDKFDIASIAKNVCICADEGDKVARFIIYEAAYRLAKHFDGIKNRKFVIGLSGSLFGKCSYLRKQFYKIVNKEYPKIHLLYDSREPVTGAIKIALSRYR